MGGISGKGETYYSLKLMAPGEIVEIVHIDCEGCLGGRLRDLGLREGAIVEIQNRDPLTGKIILRIDQNFLALDERLSSKILVRPVVACYREMRDILYYDSLTGCCKRDLTERLLERLVLHSPCAIALADLDDFKRINDRYGHLCGDQVLREIGHLLKSKVRKQDLVVRWGGEEFLLYLAKTPIDLALRICERIREAVQNLVILFEGQEIRITVSMGLCGVPPPKKMRDLINEADRALYRAKREGKNRVCLCGGTHGV